FLQSLVPYLAKTWNQNSFKNWTNSLSVSSISSGVKVETLAPNLRRFCTRLKMT
ncbi:Uncharacterized protein DAT39_018445, partial [Clarias magur]